MTYFSNLTLTKKALIGLVSLSIVGTPAIAQDAESDATVKSDIKALTCWDIVTLNRDDQIAALTLIYGYTIGSIGQSVISSEESNNAILATLNECVEKPDATVFAVIREKVSMPNPAEPQGNK